MRAVNVESSVHGNLKLDLRGSQREGSAVSVLRPRLYTTSTASADFASDERFAVGHSLCSCQRPLPVERLVQLFVVDTRYVPPTARRQLDPVELPPVLEHVAVQAQRCFQAWFAWTDGPRTWFVVAEMATVTSRHRKQQAVRMFFYDEDGRFVSWGTWALHPGGWILCER